MVCPHNVVWFVMPEKALYPFPAVQTVCYFLGNNHSPVHRQGCCQLGELMSAWWTTLVRHRYSNIYSANTEMCAPQLLNSHLSWRTCSKVKKKKNNQVVLVSELNTVCCKSCAANFMFPVSELITPCWYDFTCCSRCSMLSRAITRGESTSLPSSATLECE